MRVAVVGHVEWIEFVHVDRLPRAGEIIHAEDAWEEPGGGGAVIAVQLLKLAGEAVFFTALGDDDHGHRALRDLRSMGLRVEAAFKPTAQRRAVTFTDARGERTITVIGDRLGPSADDQLPWSLLDHADAVYFTAGDDDALRFARRARVLVATPRVLPQLARVGVALDALVGSGRDAGERYEHGDLTPLPGVAVWTEGKAGGRYATAGGRSGRFEAAPVPGPVVDAYGCGDSFAGGLTFALGEDRPLEEALALAARCGAACLTGRGPYQGQLTLAPGPSSRPGSSELPSPPAAAT
jgi:ribokinase